SARSRSFIRISLIRIRLLMRRRLMKTATAFPSAHRLRAAVECPGKVIRRTAPAPASRLAGVAHRSLMPKKLAVRVRAPRSGLVQRFTLRGQARRSEEGQGKRRLWLSPCPDLCVVDPVFGA